MAWAVSKSRLLATVRPRRALVLVEGPHQVEELDRHGGGADEDAALAEIEIEPWTGSLAVREVPA
jgi:hypothetical protein